MSCGGCKNSGDSSHGCSTNSKGEFSCDIIDTCEYSYKLSVFDWLANIKSPLNECEYVEVRFKNERKSFYHNIDKLPLHIGSIVTVESSSGYDVGVVSLTGELVRIQMKKKNWRRTSLQNNPYSYKKRCRNMAKCPKKGRRSKERSEKNRLESKS